MATLEINNVLVDLGENKLVFSKSAYPFDDWFVKELTYSERVTIPETPQLNELFGRPKSPDVKADKFNRLYSFKYKDFATIVFSGSAILLDFNENKEYELQLLDSSVDLFSAMKNELNALQLDSYDFIFNSTNYNTLKVPTDNVWLWAASSMHEQKTNAKNVLSGNLAFSRPYFSGANLIRKMFSENGWTYELSLFSEFFDKLIFSARPDFHFTSYEKSFSGIIPVTTSYQLDVTSPDFIKTDSVSGSYTLLLNYNTKIRLRGNVNATADFIFRISGTATSGETLVNEYLINEGDNEIDYTSESFNAETPTYNLTFDIVGDGTVTLDNLLLYTIIDENDFGSISSANFVDFKVKTYDNLPDIEQVDLYKHMLVNIGGFFTTDNFRKKIKINTLKQLSKLGSIDWSNKYIEDTAKITGLKGFAKKNYYLYDNDDFKPFNLGRGFFTINNQTFDDTKNIYESDFAASQEVVIGSDTMIDNTIYSDTKRLDEFNNLIGYYEISGTYTVARFAELNGNRILSEYYSNFVNAIQNGIIIECNFSLNKSDFFLFDFTRLVYVSQLKSTFYVLNISDYTEGEQTTVRLLKA